MALSNLKREPRREITESAIGIFAVGAYICLDYYIVCWALGSYPAQADRPMAIGFLMTFFGLVGPAIVAALLFFTHFAGEVVCGWLRAIGADPRPRQRY